jgi:ketol-acid reductoisomerase
VVARKGAVWRGDTCLLCGELILKNEFPVMMKSGKRPEYAHKECFAMLASIEVIEEEEDDL